MKGKTAGIISIVLGAASWMMLFRILWIPGFAAAAAALILGTVRLRAHGPDERLALIGVALAVGSALVCIGLLKPAL